MSITRKPDLKEIKAHLDNLKSQSWLGQPQAWWPNYLFRFDDIEKAANILNSGKLYSRNKAFSKGLMSSDSASPDVIAITSDCWKDYARLYFRPRTPTQFDGEGFRPKDCWVLGAHFPVPIVMLFDAFEILSRSDSRFSNGNLAKRSQVKIGDDADFLKNMPFRLVYHDTWFSESEKESIIFHRNAEVIVPSELDLLSLRFIICRSQAEYETLLCFLDPNVQKLWSEKIGVKSNLHFRYWSFVEQVYLSDEKLIFRFNPSTKTPGPFFARVDIVEDETGGQYNYEDKSFMANSTLELNLKPVRHPDSYTVSLLLDSQLAYKNHYQKYDIPF